MIKKTRLILADDHALVREGLRNALSGMAGVEIVAEVADGIELLAALRRFSAECLLVDVTMPNFEPVKVIQQIRLTYPRLKILVVSAYDSEQYIQGLFQVGVNGYHLKDLPLSDLRRAVQHIMAGGRWMPERVLDKLLKPAPQTIKLPDLTPRQREILNYLRQGQDNYAIAREIGISIKTVENHLTRLYRQLNVQNRLEAVSIAAQFPTLLEPTPEYDWGQSADSRSILLVDDNVRFRRQLRRIVMKFRPNLPVYEAATIQQARQLCQTHNPDLIFVDVVLENEDGVRCTEQLRRITTTTRIILISAYPDREFHRRGLKAGANAFIDKKDLDSAALQAILNDIFV